MALSDRKCRATIQVLPRHGRRARRLQRALAAVLPPRPPSVHRPLRSSAQRRPWPAQALADVLNYGKNLPYAFGLDGGAGASNGPCYTTLDHFDAFLTSDDSPAPSDRDAVLLYLTAKPFAENLPGYNLDMTEFSFDDMVSAFPQPEPAKEKLLQVLAVNGWDSADTWNEDSVTQSRPWCARRSFFAR